MPVVVSGDTADTSPQEIRFHLDVDRVVKVLRGDSAWTVTEERLPWTTDTLIMRGTVTSSLYAAVEEGARELLPAKTRQELAWNIADIYEYRFDMSRDLQAGDVCACCSSACAPPMEP